jgi:hypothetical protein
VTGIDIQSVIDDDTLATASATSLATSESIKAYVDTVVGGGAYWSRTGTNIYPTTAADTLKISSFEPETATGTYIFKPNTTNGYAIVELKRTVQNDICKHIFTSAATQQWEAGMLAGSDTYAFRNIATDTTIYNILASDVVQMVKPLYLQATTTVNTTGNMVFEGAATNYNIHNTGNILHIQNAATTTNIVHLDATNVRLYDGLTVGSPTYNAQTGKMLVYGTSGNATEHPGIEFRASADAYPLMHIFPFTHDSSYICFDSYFNADGWRSSDAGSNYKIGKVNDKFMIRYDSGIAAGNAITWNTGMEMTTGGAVAFPAVYGTEITGIDLYINALGYIGYQTSLRDTKTEITDILNTDIIYQLKPREFYIKLNDPKTGTFYDELLEPTKYYGFIAEEVEEVDPNICFYSDYDKLKDGEISTKEQHPFDSSYVLKDKPILKGIREKQVIALLVKAVQDQKTYIDTLEARISALESK